MIFVYLSAHEFINFSLDITKHLCINGLRAIKDIINVTCPPAVARIDAQVDFNTTPLSPEFD